MNFKIAKKIRVFLLVVACIMSIVGLNLSNNYAKARAHNPEDIKIKIISCESKYDENATFYVNGCYYVYFNYEIINETSADIDYIDVVAHYTDHSGKSIGNITTSFGGYDSSSMNLKAGTKQIHETYISENRPEEDQFFTTLYNSDFSEFTVTYKILSVKFSDGERYDAN